MAVHTGGLLEQFVPSPMYEPEKRAQSVALEPAAQLPGEQQAPVIGGHGGGLSLQCVPSPANTPLGQFFRNEAVHRAPGNPDSQQAPMKGSQGGGAPAQVVP